MAQSVGEQAPSRSSSVRAAAKSMTEHVLLSSGIPALSRRRRRGDVLILAYHNVVPDDAGPCGDAALHLPRSRFAAQLDALARTHDVVALADVLAESGERHDRPRAVITFDDAYRGAVTLGAAELAQRRMMATAFVAPAFIGGSTFWWDRVAWSESVGTARDFRRRALEECAGRTDAVLALAAQSGVNERDVPAYARCASEAELSEAVFRGTLSVASHSWSHPNMAALTDADLRDELVRPLEWLRERFESALPVLAYPYGRFSTAVIAAARKSGYAAALRNDGGWMSAGGGDRLLTPRLDVPAGLSAAGFALRASGLFAG